MQVILDYSSQNTIFKVNHEQALPCLMVVQAKPLQILIRLRVIDQDKQGIVQMLSFGVFAKGGDLHNPFNNEIEIWEINSGGINFWRN